MMLALARERGSGVTRSGGENAVTPGKKRAGAGDGSGGRIGGHGLVLGREPGCDGPVTATAGLQHRADAAVEISGLGSI
jgi:hypothetical protein